MATVYSQSGAMPNAYNQDSQADSGTTVSGMIKKVVQTTLGHAADNGATSFTPVLIGGKALQTAEYSGSNGFSKQAFGEALEAGQRNSSNISIKNLTGRNVATAYMNGTINPIKQVLSGQNSSAGGIVGTGFLALSLANAGSNVNTAYEQGGTQAAAFEAGRSGGEIVLGGMGASAGAATAKTLMPLGLQYGSPEKLSKASDMGSKVLNVVKSGKVYPAAIAGAIAGGMLATAVYRNVLGGPPQEAQPRTE
ncbi:MAG: hypothetical protein AAGI66_08115 [Cyanobacteria bacterium P01_H01_bin.74]